MKEIVARFELVLEGVTGFGGRIDALREEMVGQFTEVGRQIRFLSDRIAENRAASAANRADLGAEMIRLGEMIGATRVEFREQLASTRSQFEQGVEAAAAQARQSLNYVHRWLTKSLPSPKRPSTKSPPHAIGLASIFRLRPRECATKLRLHQKRW